MPINWGPCQSQTRHYSFLGSRLFFSRFLIRGPKQSSQERTLRRFTKLDLCKQAHDEALPDIDAVNELTVLLVACG